ncbi:MAG: branched-chain amino acid aminotransferase [Candidatus Aminicenantes bacterium]|nr:branched-chain amino acid aminotransferase [Candidatus Aminicenantes bacterium]
MEIKKTVLPSEKLKPLFTDATALLFGKQFTDYMFTLDYTKEKGWHNPEIKPYSMLTLDPAALVFHYSQEVFEGQKAYKSPSGDILLFRPRENARRLNKSLERMCMPTIPEDDILAYESELLKLEKRWIPDQKGTALYMRPTVIATEAVLGVRPSSRFLFYIILSPSGPYFPEGFNPVGLWSSREISRAAEGGTGAVKAGGNYGGSLLAIQTAVDKGYSQVLWLDAKEHRYIEEAGAMNLFFVINDKLITPPLTGTILPGITRKSILEIASDLGIQTEEKMITIEELCEGIQEETVTEVFGAGTAAVVSPFGKLNVDGEEYIINNNQTGPWSKKIYDELTAIQYGEKPDPYGWVYTIT